MKKKKSNPLTKEVETKTEDSIQHPCNDEMTFQECELAILRQSVDESEKLQGEKIANSEEIKKIIDILEKFLIRKKCICYGGTAINNILPKIAQFYDKSIQIPDYDFYSLDAMNDAKELADIYYENGYTEVEAKSGVHYGTFKVFVNFIGIADITQLHPKLFRSILKESIDISGILYAPPNFLRLNMFLELSRPSGDVSRWEKILKRLNLLNEYYPLKTGNIHCDNIDFQRKMDTNTEHSEKLYFLMRDTFINHGVIFFGGYATTLYSKYMPKNERILVQHIPDFDVLSENPTQTANVLIEQLKENGYKATQTFHEEIGEVIPKHIEIKVGKDTLAFIYEPIACHNYNTIEINGKKVNIATIDTILSFYLAFYYANDPYNYKDRMLCIAKFLFEVEQNNRLAQDGLLKRFTLRCFGKQPTIQQIRLEKLEKYEELKHDKNSEEYQQWFLKYVPKFLSKSSKPEKQSSQSSTKSPIIEPNITKKNRKSYKSKNNHPVHEIREPPIQYVNNKHKHKKKKNKTHKKSVWLY